MLDKRGQDDHLDAIDAGEFNAGHVLEINGR
jgi:hypothetical protein